MNRHIVIQKAARSWLRRRKISRLHGSLAKEKTPMEDPVKVDPKEQMAILESAINSLVHTAPEDVYHVQVQIASALSRLALWAGLRTREGQPVLPSLDDHEVAELVAGAVSCSQLVRTSANAQLKKIANLLGLATK
jgi:hypothetical protein